jgi:hypothetical protein
MERFLSFHDLLLFTPLFSFFSLPRFFFGGTLLDYDRVEAWIQIRDSMIGVAFGYDPVGIFDDDHYLEHFQKQTCDVFCAVLIYQTNQVRAYETR